MKCEACSVEWGVWSGECEVVKCEVWSGECGVWSACEV